MNYTNAIKVTEDQFKSMTAQERKEVLKPIVKNLNRNIRRLENEFGDYSPAIESLHSKIVGKKVSGKLPTTYPKDKFKTPNDYKQMQTVFNMAKDFVKLQTGTIRGERLRRERELNAIGKAVGNDAFREYYNSMTKADKRKFWEAYRKIQEDPMFKSWLSSGAGGEYESGKVINTMAEVLRKKRGKGYKKLGSITMDDFIADIKNELEEVYKKNVLSL